MAVGNSLSVFTPLSVQTHVLTRGSPLGVGRTDHIALMRVCMLVPTTNTSFPPVCVCLCADLARHAVCVLPAQDQRHNHHRGHNQQRGECLAVVTFQKCEQSVW